MLRMVTECFMGSLDCVEYVESIGRSESILLGGAKRILGCLSNTCNEAVRGDMG